MLSVDRWSVNGVFWVAKLHPVGRKEQAAASRAGLVEAARQCFVAYGYEATTVAGVLERAGMARGALYHYFPGGKRELFTAVFDVVDGAFHQRRDAVFAVESPLGRIREGVRVFFDLCTKEEFARIVLIDAPNVVPSQTELGSSFDLLRTQLREALDAGEAREFQVEVMATTLYGAVRRAGEFVFAAPDRRHASDEAARAIDLLLDGLQHPRA